MSSDTTTNANAGGGPEPVLGIPNQFITTHDAEGLPLFSKQQPEALEPHNIPGFTWFEGYKSFTSPIELTDEADLKALKSDGPAGAIPGFPTTGSWVRYCDWAPGAVVPMHRTESVDFGVVVHGEMEAILDGGETRRLKVGDSIVQRGTLHGWKNPSETEWARMFFVLQGTPPVKVQGQTLGQDLGRF